MNNHYQILGCRKDASYDEIKRRYHDLVLKCHPDKGDSSDNGGSPTFQEIDEAWKVLRDPIRRRAYDENVRHRMLEEKNLLFGSFKLSDLDYDAVTETYSCVCKCGGVYNLSREGCEEFNSCLVGCEQCSLMISVDFK